MTSVVLVASCSTEPDAFGCLMLSCLHTDLRSAPQENGCTIDLTNAGGGGGGHRRTQHMLGVWLSGEEATCRSQPSRAAQIRLHIYTSRLKCANCSQLLWAGFELVFEPFTLSSLECSKLFVYLQHSNRCSQSLLTLF